MKTLKTLTETTNGAPVAVALLMLTALTASALLSGHAAAQGQSGVQVTTGFTVKGWTIDSASDPSIDITQVTVPITVSTTLGADNAMRLSLISSGVRSEVSSGGGPSLGGPTDTRLQLTYRPPGERLLVVGGVSMPTGRTDLDDQEVIVSRTVSNRVLDFRVSSHGEGTTVFGNAIGAWPLSDRFSIGATAGYVYSGEYNYAPGAILGLGKVDPGNVLTLSGGLSYRRHEESLWSGARNDLGIDLDLTLRDFSNTKVEGEDLFREGNEIELLGTGTLGTARNGVTLLGRAVFKGDNELGVTGTDPQAGDPVLNLLFANVTGDWWELAADAFYRQNTTLRFGAYADLRSYDALQVKAASSDDTVEIRGKSLVWAIGPTAEWQIARGVALAGTAGYAAGNAADGDLDLTGFDLAIAVRLGF